MKIFFVFIALLAAGYLLYQNYFNKEIIEVTENIIVTQASGMDINAGPSPPPRFAYIEGSIKNTGDKNLSNVVLKYTTGYDTLTALIGFLAPDQSVEFKTNNCRVRNSNPQYTLEEIRYVEGKSLNSL